MTTETQTAATNAADTGTAAATTDTTQAADGQAAQATAAPADGQATQSAASTSQDGQTAVEYADFTAPEGLTFNPETLGEFKELAKAKGLSQEDAQKFADLGGKVVKMQHENYARQIEAAQTQWAEASRTDKEIGGDKFEENCALAKRALDTFGSPELAKMMEESGLGNHPDVLRAFVRIGRAISEDRLVAGTTRPGASDSLKKMYPTM